MPKSTIDAKVVLGFITDVLYLKGIICFEEFDDIQNSSDIHDLDAITEKMLRGEYNVYKRGETYIGYGNNSKE